MKIKALCIILCILCAATAFSQNENSLSVYPHVGLNLSTYDRGMTYFLDNGEGFTFTPKYTIGYIFGGELVKQNHNLGVTLGLDFVLERIKYEDVIASSEDYKIQSKNLSTSNSYLKTPLLVSYSIWGNDYSRIYIKSGIQPIFLLHNTTKSTLYYYKRENDQWIIINNLSGKSEGSSTSVYKKIQLAIPIGISYEYKQISIDFRYNIGLTNVYKYTDVKAFNRNFALTVGYRITL